MMKYNEDTNSFIAMNDDEIREWFTVVIKKAIDNPNDVTVESDINWKDIDDVTI